MTSGIANFDRQFATAVEASRSKVDGTDDGAHVIGEEQLGMQLQALQLVHLDADVVHDAHAADGFDQLLLLQLVRRARQNVHLHAALLGSHEALDDDGILIALVLHPEGVLRLVDELPDALAAVADTPDQMGIFAGLELLPLPVGVEALDDFVDFVRMRGGDGVIAGSVRFFVSQFSDWMKAVWSSTTIDFS